MGPFLKFAYSVIFPFEEIILGSRFALIVAGKEKTAIDAANELELYVTISSPFNRGQALATEGL